MPVRSQLSTHTESSGKAFFGGVEFRYSNAFFRRARFTGAEVYWEASARRLRRHPTGGHYSPAVTLGAARSIPAPARLVAGHPCCHMSCCTARQIVTVADLTWQSGQTRTALFLLGSSVPSVNINVGPRRAKRFTPPKSERASDHESCAIARALGGVKNAPRSSAVNGTVSSMRGSFTTLAGFSAMRLQWTALFRATRIVRRARNDVQRHASVTSPSRTYFQVCYP